MRDLVAIAGVVLLALAAGAVAVAIGDRHLFVPPPESVAENFVRHLATGRYDRAHALFSDAATRRSDPKALSHLAEDLERSVGVIEQIEGESLTADRLQATARAKVRGSRIEGAMNCSLVWEHAMWRIEGCRR
jgi:hypothetical protein